jgi:dipeptidyl aminopeptidase/acylaminoacyl peptidase
VFKAVVAITPVTDLGSSRRNGGGGLTTTCSAIFVGDGAQLHEGSPARDADKIKGPVLLLHGALDRNVAIAESRHMAQCPEEAGVPHELVTWDDLDHQLD